MKTKKKAETRLEKINKYLLIRMKLNFIRFQYLKKYLNPAILNLMMAMTNQKKLYNLIEDALKCDALETSDSVSVKYLLMSKTLCRTSKRIYVLKKY